MKKIVLLVAVVSVSGKMFASVNPSVPKVFRTFDKVNLLEDSVFMKTEEGDCYARICKTISIDQGDGISVEYKQCSDWEKIDCSDKKEEEAPIV